MVLKLFDLKFDELFAINSFLSVREALYFQGTCKYLHNEDIGENFWKSVLTRNKFLREDSGGSSTPTATSSVLLSKPRGASFRWFGEEILRRAKRISPQGMQLEVVASSRPDRSEERAENVLSISRCKTIINALRNRGDIAQYHCGCGRNQPCYYSSAPNPDPASSEYIIFRTSVPHYITSFTITPYQAHFQPGKPVFAPQLVKLEVVLPFHDPAATASASRTRQTFEIIHQTPEYPVQNQFRTQVFHFPAPLFLLPGACVRVLFLGKQQRQPIAGNDDYYMCLSNFKLIGFPVDGLVGEAASVGSSAAATVAAFSSATLSAGERLDQSTDELDYGPELTSHLKNTLLCELA